ncbi:MAG: hypothetical protein RQ885_02255 [Desulfurococcales archaeon]|nr:hypothetical protein [Desulfurococcales archaeon]
MLRRGELRGFDTVTLKGFKSSPKIEAVDIVTSIARIKRPPRIALRKPQTCFSETYSIYIGSGLYPFSW